MTRFSVGHLVTNDLETMPGKVGYNVKLCQLIQGASGRMLGHKRGWILAVSCQVISEIGIIVCGTISTCHVGRISVNTGTPMILPLLLLKKGARFLYFCFAMMKEQQKNFKWAPSWKYNWLMCVLLPSFG